MYFKVFLDIMVLPIRMLLISSLWFTVGLMSIRSIQLINRKLVK